MNPGEKMLKENSKYYTYTPSMRAKTLYFYPMVIGNFFYKKGYELSRVSFDSFLIMQVRSGKLEVTINSNNFLATEGDVVYINCYEKHRYKALTDVEIIWLHFDGTLAQDYFNVITDNTNFIFACKQSNAVAHLLAKIYNSFETNVSIKEAAISLEITTILTELIKFTENNNEYKKNKTAVETAIIYITENLDKNPSLAEIASNSSLSVFYFTKIFSRETGFTPHQYMLYCKINRAKFLLVNSLYSIKEICFKCGFSCESNFSTTFKKHEKLSPTQYRQTNAK